MRESFLTPGWVRRHGKKMDARVRRHFVDACRPLRRTPSPLQTGVSKWLGRRRLPILIEIEPSCTELDRSAVERRLHRGRCGRVRNLGLVNAVAGEIPFHILAELLDDERVRRATFDREVYALLDVAAPTVRAPRVWESRAAVTGEGVTVAVIDTGIDPHPDFTQPENRIRGFCDLVGERRKRGKRVQAPYDDNGHGTHVAGIVAGNAIASDGKYKGIAPGAALVGVKVLDAHGRGRLSTIIEGIEWCVTHRGRYGIRVLNLSLGGPAQGPWEEDPLAVAVGAAWDRDLTVCVAAGNDGPGPGTIGSPAIHPRVISVGASDDRGMADRADDTIAHFSSRGPAPGDVKKPDLVAPGKEITAAMAPNSLTAIGSGKRGALYLALSGTSMATPAVSGIAALVMESAESGSKSNGGRLSPDEVKARLTRSTFDLSAERNAQGSGLADAWAAVSAPSSPLQTTVG